MSPGPASGRQDLAARTRLRKIVAWIGLRMAPPFDPLSPEDEQGRDPEFHEQRQDDGLTQVCRQGAEKAAEAAQDHQGAQQAEGGAAPLDRDDAGPEGES